MSPDARRRAVTAESSRQRMLSAPALFIRGLPESPAEIAAGITGITACLESFSPVTSWWIPMRRWDGSAADLERVMGEAARRQRDGTQELYLAARGELATGGGWQVSLTLTRPASPQDEVFVVLRPTSGDRWPSEQEMRTLLRRAVEVFAPLSITVSDFATTRKADELKLPQPVGRQVWLHEDQLGPDAPDADTGDFTLTELGPGLLLCGPDHLGAEEIATRSQELVTRLRRRADAADCWTAPDQVGSITPGTATPADSAADSAAAAFADEIGEGCASYLALQDQVVLSRPLTSFLDACRSEGRRPVLVTPESAQLSPALARELDEHGAHWAIRAPDGALYDASCGLAIRSLPELWEPPGRWRAVHAGYRDGLRRAWRPAAFVLDARAHHRTFEGAHPLALTMAAMDALGMTPRASGPSEPCLAPWDPEQLAREFRTDVTGIQRMILASEGAGSVTVEARAVPDGHHERTFGTFGLDLPYGAITFGIVRRAEDVLRRLAEEFDLSSGLISLIEADGPRTVGRAARAVSAPLPLAVFVGERLIDALDGPEHDELDAAAARFRGETVQRHGSTGLLLGQSVDVDEFADLALRLARLDPELRRETAAEPAADTRRPGPLRRLLRRMGR